MKILSVMFMQLPAPPAGAIETWLVCAAAVTSLVVLAMKLFVRKPPIEAEFVSKAEFRMFRESVERESMRSQTLHAPRPTLHAPRSTSSTSIPPCERDCSNWAVRRRS